MRAQLKAPFPYFGGKSAVARLIWDRLGDVDNYIEPFAGSLAMALVRPHKPRVETGNDADCYVANFWRAVSRDPEVVAEYADNPVFECDLHARHRWLVLSDAGAEFRRRMREDPDYFDAKFAGWWCWGLCCWIGSGWCVDPNGKAVSGPQGGSGERMPQGGSGERMPQIGNQMGHGVTAQGDYSQRTGLLKGNNRPQLGDAYARGRGVNASDAASTCAERRAWLLDWFGRLRDRLRMVRICCGDWSRVCNSESTTTRLGLTGVFFDPPYGAAAKRDSKLYSVDSLTVADQVRTWCLQYGSNRQMRIALCGYEGEHEELEAHGWGGLSWKAQGGYGNRKGSNANAAKERIWFSPHCRRERELFD